VPEDAICANELGQVGKQICGCTDSACQLDTSIDQNCNDGGDLLCIEGDKDTCCARAGDKSLGQCLRFDPGAWINIENIYSKSEANCCDDLDVYAYKRSG
jgi:hypothetical protein